ncbi:hypothetical protein QVD17_34908 [Tagetes erecta]|uniref:J domain-containing protein n=1 Tax=Tagetes erecta TaxID=13708 RepID=A0AAD8K2K6_TARER|nr:hypothetical protein QVD17_34908 [Tagetes erecta]
MATTSGMIVSSSSSIGKLKGDRKIGKRFAISCCVSMSSDPYKILKIDRGASESEIKKAFRKLVFKYHPDVCKESDGGTQFQLINEAYHMVMSDLRGEASGGEMDDDGPLDETMRGMNDPDWELWEEWMGWEGAGIRDYSSHINPYI